MCACAAMLVQRGTGVCVCVPVPVRGCAGAPGNERALPGAGAAGGAPCRCAARHRLRPDPALPRCPASRAGVHSRPVSTGCEFCGEGAVGKLPRAPCSSAPPAASGARERRRRCKGRGDPAPCARREDRQGVCKLLKVGVRRVRAPAAQNIPPGTLPSCSPHRLYCTGTAGRAVAASVPTSGASGEESISTYGLLLLFLSYPLS